MSANRHLAAAALFTALTAACAAASAQPMYRCGNQFQDKPCADGKGRVVEQKGATAPAAAAQKGSPPGAATTKAANPQQALARQCVYLRDQMNGASPRTREDLQTEQRKIGCGYEADGGRKKEEACAAALTGQEIAEACGTKRR